MRVFVTGEEAAAHFGWLAEFIGSDSRASSAQTRAKLRWNPTGRGLIADLDNMRYFYEMAYAEPLHR